MTEVRVPPSGPFEAIEGGAVPPLSSVFYVDKGTAVAPADQDGSIAAPFSTIAAFIAAAVDAPTINFVQFATALIAPGDYSDEGEQAFPSGFVTWVSFVALGERVTLPAFATSDPLAGVFSLLFDGCLVGALTLAQNMGEAQCDVILQNGAIATGVIDMWGSLFAQNLGPRLQGVEVKTRFDANVTCRTLIANGLFVGGGCAELEATGNASFQNTSFNGAARIVTCPDVTWDQYTRKQTPVDTVFDVTPVLLDGPPGGTSVVEVPILAAAFADVSFANAAALVGGVYVATLDDTVGEPREAALGVVGCFCNVAGTIVVRVFGTLGAPTNQSFTFVRVTP